MCPCISTIQLLRSEMSYLSHDVSVLSVHLGNGSKITDHAEHIVHLQQRGRRSDDPRCTNATFFHSTQDLNFAFLVFGTYSDVHKHFSGELIVSGLF